jgi:hypothetical protein
MELRHMFDRTLFKKPKKMVSRRPVAIDCLHRGSENLFVVLEPSFPDVGNADLLEAQRRRGADFELRVDLRSQLLGRCFVRSDARSAPGALVVVTQIPSIAAAAALSGPTRGRRLVPWSW